MSHINKIIRDIDQLILRSRGTSLDQDDTAMLEDAMKRLNGHFHCLHRKPYPHWPEGYLQLEADYCRVATLQKRREFNDIWNSTHTETFRIQDGWGRD